MASGSFHFKTFTIHQQKTAFKVGTDSVILGAWADINDSKTLLDVGTGTGLLALIMASKFPKITITAVELDAESAAEAEQNFKESSFHHRIKIVCEDFKSWVKSQAPNSFDAIISNPPYFHNDLKNPDHRKAAARHTSSLNFNELAEGVSLLLDNHGLFYIILPAEQFDSFSQCALAANLYPSKKLYIKNKPSGTIIRIAACFAKSENKIIESALCIRNDDHQYSADYIHLTKDLYIKNLNQKKA
jgi:tRNA1Val (adenine37-N6)-methyltransferase